MGAGIRISDSSKSGNAGEMWGMVGKLWGNGVKDLLAQQLAAFRCHDVMACHEITEYSLSLPTFHSRSP